MLGVLTEVILPVALTAALGGLAGRRWRFDLDTFSRAVFFLFSPCLVFEGLATLEIAGGELLRLLVVVLAVFVANVAVAQVLARARGEDGAGIAGMTLASAMANQGNIGLPVARLAFGPAGLSVATLIWAINLVLANSVGVAVASMGRVGLAQALRAPFRYPSLYAALAGVVVQITDVELPVAAAETVATMADAAIPSMLIVLGLQFSWPARGALLDPGLVAVNRLVVGPLVALGAATAVGLEGMPWRVSILQAGMPTAAMVAILAAELRARPADAVRAVVVTTVASLASLTVLVALLRP